MTFETLLYDVADRVATVTLNRPDRLNAVNTTVIRELVEAFDRADGDDGVRAVIVTGAGRAFCAGADLGGGGKTFAGGPGRAERPEDHRDGGGLVTLRIFDMKKPLIAAINGPAVGFGATLTLAMDIRLASSAAKHRLRLRPARRRARGVQHLVPAAPGRHRAGRRVGLHRARLLGRGSAATAGWSAGWSRRTRCCRRPATSRARSPTTPPRSRSRSSAR